MKLTRQDIASACLAALMTTAAAAQTPAEPNDIFEQSRALRRQFMIQKASPVAAKTPQEEETSLTKLIEQVLSLTIPAKHDPNARATAESSLSPAAALTDKTEHSAAPDAAAKTGNADPHKTALDKLGTPDGKQAVPYPMQLADVLYQAGSIRQAGQFYQIALNAANKDNASDYQWLLFQTANCLRQTDTMRAVALYEQLIQASPNSVWAAAAQARIGMLNWMQTNEHELQTRVAIRNPNEQ